MNSSLVAIKIKVTASFGGNSDHRKSLRAKVIAFTESIHPTRRLVPMVQKWREK